jgi:hypothetical protein
MILQIRVSDDLYTHYAKRNPGDPRKAIEEALETLKDLEPGVPRLVVENPELRELKQVAGIPLDSPHSLLEWAKKHANFSLSGFEVELSLGQRQRLAQMAGFMNVPVDAYVKQQVGSLLVRELGG